MSKRLKMHILTAVCGIAMTALAGLAQAVPTSAFEINSPIGFSNGSWSFGEIFTVGSSSINVTSLGAFDEGKNGFVTTTGIKVGLFRESDGALLASTNVLSTDGLVGNYRFHDIVDVVLNANTQYRVVGVNESDLYNVSGPPSVVDPSITWNGYGYCNTTSLTFCNVFNVNNTGNNFTWMANFQIDGTGNVPEPQTMLLVAAAALALAASRRRKQV